MSCTILQHMILEKTTWHYMALYDTRVLWKPWEANQYLLDWSDNTVLLPSIAGCIRTGAPMLMEASYHSCGANSMQSLFGRCCNLWIGHYHAPFQAGYTDKKFWTSCMKKKYLDAPKMEYVLQAKQHCLKGCPCEASTCEGYWRDLGSSIGASVAEGLDDLVMFAVKMSNSSCYLDFLHFFFGRTWSWPGYHACLLKASSCH